VELGESVRTGALRFVTAENSLFGGPARDDLELALFRHMIALVVIMIDSVVAVLGWRLDIAGIIGPLEERPWGGGGRRVGEGQGPYEPGKVHFSGGNPLGTLRQEVVRWITSGIRLERQRVCRHPNNERGVLREAGLENNKEDGGGPDGGTCR